MRFHKDLNSLFDLTNFTKTTYFPKKSKPYFYNKNGIKVEIAPYDDC